MKSLKFFMLLFVLNVSTLAWSQISYDLSKYTFPDVNRKSLEGQFYLNGSNRMEKSPYWYQYFSYDEYKNNQYNGNLSLYFNQFISKSDFQREVDVLVDLSASSSKSKIENELNNKNANFSSRLGIDFKNRKYIKDTNYFETDIYTVLNYYTVNQTNNIENKSNGLEFLTYIPLKIGKGRIDQVQDARHAVSIFEELSKINRVQGNISEKEILVLAQLISKLKNKRFFDSRIRRMMELECIDSLLKKNNLISESDAKYFTTLTDIWDFGNLPIIHSGTRIAGVIQPGFYHSNYNSNQSNQTINELSQNILLFDLGIELKYEKPISLSLQNSIIFNVIGGIYNGKINDNIDESEDKISLPNLRISFDQMYGYYPNTRTYFNLGYHGQFVKIFDKSDENVIGFDNNIFRFGTDVSFNYYISPQFRLSATSVLNYTVNKSDNKYPVNFNNFNPLIPSTYIANEDAYISVQEKLFTHYFSIGLIYSIF